MIFEIKYIRNHSFDTSYLYIIAKDQKTAESAFPYAVEKYGKANHFEIKGIKACGFPPGLVPK